MGNRLLSRNWPIKRRSEYVTTCLAAKVKAIYKEVLSVNYCLSSENAEVIEIININGEPITIVNIGDLHINEIENRVMTTLYNALNSRARCVNYKIEPPVSSLADINRIIKTTVEEAHDSIGNQRGIY